MLTMGIDIGSRSSKCVILDDGNDRARAALESLAAVDPCRERRQRTLERLDLADTTAGIRIGEPQFIVGIMLHEILLTRLDRSHIAQSERRDQRIAIGVRQRDDRAARFRLPAEPVHDLRRDQQQAGRFEHGHRSFGLHRPAAFGDQDQVVELAMRMRSNRPTRGARTVIETLGVEEMIGNRAMRLAIKVESRNGLLEHFAHPSSVEKSN